MRPASAHRNDIQGLRAVAVILVVLDHAGVPVVSGGFVGVDVFFVLSGFLITSLLLAEARAKGSISLVDFYFRRARRILPAAALTLLVTEVAAVFLLNFLRAKDAVQDSMYAAAFGANFRFAARGTNYFTQTEPPSPLLHFWSLSVEEQFYLVWPALLSLALFGFALGRRRTLGERQQRRLLVVLVLLTAASLIYSVHLTAALPPQAYFSPFARAWELGLGAALAVGASAFVRVPTLVKVAMGWAGLAAIAVAATVFSARTPFPGYWALVPTVGTALVIAAGIGSAQPRLAAGRLLAVRPMCIAGDRSYAYYLWHWPVLIIAAAFVGHDLSLGVKLGLMAGAFLLACVSYALVENPLRRRTRSRTATGLVVAVAMGAVFGTAVLSLNDVNAQMRRFESSAAAAATAAPDLAPVSYRTKSGVPGALPAVVTAVQAAKRGAPIPSGLTPSIHSLASIPSAYALPSGCLLPPTSSQVASKICRVGRPSSSKLLVLIGDSHAHMWLPAVLRMARRDGWAVVPLLRLGCMPNTLVTHEGRDVCRAWFRWATAQAARLHPRVTLIGGSVGERDKPSTRAAVEGVLAMAGAIRNSGRVVVIGDPEGLRFGPVDCLLGRHASMATCTTTWPASTLQFYDRIAARARAHGFGFLDTRGWLCYERRCPAVIGHTIAYWDNSHITMGYAAQLVEPFRVAFRRAVGQS